MRYRRGIRAIYSKLTKKSSIIRRVGTHVVISNEAKSVKTTRITLGGLNLASADVVKSIIIHKFGSTIYQLVDYSYDLDWSANSPESVFIIIYTYNGHEMASQQGFEINVTYAG